MNRMKFKRNYFNKIFCLAIFNMMHYYDIEWIYLGDLPPKSEKWKTTACMLFNRRYLGIMGKYEIFKYVSQMFCAQKAYIDIELVILILKTFFFAFFTNRPSKIANDIKLYICIYARTGRKGSDYLNKDISNEFLRWSGFDV